MSEVQIPLDDIDPLNTWFDFSVDLSGTEYIFELNWNTENEFWYISMFLADKTPIFQGRAIRVNYNLFEFCSSELLPVDGRLYAIDTSGANTDPTDSDLGTRVILVYTDDI